MEGLVYPDFSQSYVDFYNPLGKWYGGIDWGWRNPFAAIWGVLDDKDVLWIQEERYLRETPLHEHAGALSKKVLWYADPAGPDHIAEFRSAGHTIRKGDNDIRLGIAAVTARVRTGRLKVNPLRCPNLCAEAKLYRYPSQSERAVMGEKPIDDNNHALGALRYLISRLDSRFIAKLRKQTRDSDGPIETESIPVEETQAAIFNIRRPSVFDDDELWEALN